MTFVPLYINGRFAAQKLSGVQRFAVEMTAALVRAYGDRVHILMPPDATLEIDGAYVVGRRTGQVWEQLELPRYAGQGILINLGNTGPVLARRQVVVIHDAGVFSTPAVYSWKFRLWYKTLQYLLVKRDARIVTVSEFSRRELVEHLPVSATDVAVIPEGADHMLRLSADAEVLREYGLAAGAVCRRGWYAGGSQEFVFAGPACRSLGRTGDGPCHCRVHWRGSLSEFKRSPVAGLCSVSWPR